MERNFMELLRAKWAEGKFVCVGLDSDLDKLPPHLRDHKGRVSWDRIFSFNLQIVAATADTVCVYKPNLAFYQKAGNDGLAALRETIAYIHQHHPDIPVILDCKQGDIGNTNEAYAAGDFADLQADAITVSPYLGSGKAAEVFVAHQDKGIIVLCRTSNKGAGEFQNLLVVVTSDELRAMLNGYKDLPWAVHDGWPIQRMPGGQPVYHIPLYQVVAMRVAHHWNKTHGNCALVVGATYPEELGIVRQLVGDLPILVPGIGKQGGSLEAVLAKGLTEQHDGLIINSSSGIIFASHGPDFAEAARRETLKLHEAVTAFRKRRLTGGAS